MVYSFLQKKQIFLEFLVEDEEDFKKKLFEALFSNREESFCDGEWQVSDTDYTLSLNGQNILVVRGWGYLTGQGCKLSYGEAIKVQDGFAEWAVEKLNNLNKK